ncbi:hypothetical protein A605_09545 [Corynebacterium halotolerans YIM 70093 = DSM 44683]|uniref:HNH nuclease domain-containing protein n=1 Tax=Corynebacterium halotolerans YIM 70093 = DSM 44683 TaxID=1121362 RepID=M1P8B8_9CORY|nr:hypothetical protein A605_09545 [Corynebacterium halotolerans YIM 70093 = DSM 44683]
MCSVTDPVAVRRHRLLRAEHELWAEVLPGEIDVLDTESVATLTARLYRSTGYSETYLVDAIHAYATLAELPRLRALQDELCHLDLYRLRIISDTLLKADHDDSAMMATIDEALTDYLTPKRANQVLPNKQALRRKINQILKSLDTTIATDDKPADGDEGTDAQRYDMAVDPDGTAHLHASLDAATGTAVDTRVRAHAQAVGMTLLEALVDLLLGAEGTKVVLNMYKAGDRPDSPAYVPGAGHLSECEEERMMARVTHTRDIDAYADVEAEGYQTPETIAAYVEGRDGVCRWPGCDRPAPRCQKDHRIDYADGGPTAAGNLVSLCQHHHNEKTARRAFYLLDPETDVVYWLFDDQSWACDEPQGPLAGQSRRWQTTVGQRLTARRNRARREAQLRKRQREEARGEGTGWEEDGHPPF